MIRKYTPALAIILFLLIAAPFNRDIQAQCKSFVKTQCLPNLAPYIHDGGYQSVIMGEGEEAEVYKTIFAGQKYRLFLCTDDNLPNVEFVVTDMSRNILFDNRKNEFIKYWDFKANTSQQIKVTVRISKSAKQNTSEQELIFGCVGMLFGLLDQ